MKVEVLIYAYLAVCTSMIVFNIVCIFVFRRREKNIEKRSSALAESILRQFENGKPDEKHKAYLRKKLKKIRHMMAFDETLEQLYSARPEQVRQYVKDLSSVFVYLTFQYHEKNPIKAAYFPYIIKKYRVFQGANISIVIDSLIELVHKTNLYCRENALQALYSIGDANSIIKALKIIDSKDNFHHSKMLADGLLSFAGDRNELDKLLWKNYDQFSNTVKLPILDYFRFADGDHSEKILEIMTDDRSNQELRFSAIRYFAKNTYEPALPHLYAFATEQSPIWEYRAIAATALGKYPCAETEELLKDLLCDGNWYVRYNAAESLERLGLAYDELIDVFEGNDRYAAEMLRYRFDRKKLKEKEVATV